MDIQIFPIQYFGKCVTIFFYHFKFLQTNKKRNTEYWAINFIETNINEQLYFSWYKLFNYKYVHIAKPNELYLNKDFCSVFLVYTAIITKVYET